MELSGAPTAPDWATRACVSSFILYGSPAVGPAEFKKHKSRTVVGTSMVIVVPVGQYDPNLLINIGSNRWAFKPEIGISRTLHSWMLELDPGKLVLSAEL